jgi:hypothetical protein
MYPQLALLSECLSVISSSWSRESRGLMGPIEADRGTSGVSDARRACNAGHAE